MNNVSPLVLDLHPVRGGAVAAVAAFLAKEGDSLQELLGALGEFDAAEAVAHLADPHNRDRLDPDKVADLLDEVLEGLRSIPFLILEHAAMAGLGPRDLHGAVRWYGARIADLSDRLES